MIEERRISSPTAAEEARALLRGHRPAEAAQVMRAHLMGRVGTAGEYMLLGVALAQSGEVPAALHALERSVTIDPNDAVAHFNLGQVYRQALHHREALKAFERALCLRPDYLAAATAANELRRQSVSSPLAEDWQPPREMVPAAAPRAQRLAAPPPATEWSPGGWASAPVVSTVERADVARPRCLTALVVLTYIGATLGLIGGIIVLLAGGLLGATAPHGPSSGDLPSATTVSGLGLLLTLISAARLALGHFLWQGYRRARLAMMGLLAVATLPSLVDLCQAPGPYEAGRAFGGILIQLIFLGVLNLDVIKEYCTR